MIGVCRECGKAFETTEEDAGDPQCLCVECYRRRKQAELGQVVEDLDEPPFQPGQWFRLNLMPDGGCCDGGPLY